MQKALIRKERDLSLLVPRSLPQKGDRGLVSWKYSSPGTLGNSWVNLHLYHGFHWSPLYSATKSEWRPLLCPSNLQSWLWSQGSHALGFYQYPTDLPNNSDRSPTKGERCDVKGKSRLETKDIDGHTPKYQKSVSYRDSAFVSVSQFQIEQNRPLKLKQDNRVPRSSETAPMSWPSLGKKYRDRW